MNDLQNQVTRTERLTMWPSQRLTVIVVLMLAGTLSYQAQAGSTKWRLSDPDLTVTGVSACPGPNGCSFEIGIHDINVDAVKCPPGKQFPEPGCDTPGHEQVNINVPVVGQLVDCTKNGSCKIKIVDVFTLDDLATIVEQETSGSGLEIPNFTDAAGETCPVLVIRSLVTDIIGFVCDAGGVAADGSCASGNLGASYNGTATVPMFEGDFEDELCLHGNFTEPTSVLCFDPDSPYACSTSFPLVP